MRIVTNDMEIIECRIIEISALDKGKVIIDLGDRVLDLNDIFRIIEGVGK